MALLDFASLKKASGNLEALSKRLAEANQANNFTKSTDDRFWQPTVDRAGNGTAVIRFLPAPAVDGDDGLPWVKMYRHFFKGPTGKWYVENSLTTIGKNDPVAESNSKLWNSGLDSNKEIARSRKRKLEYISNIEVIKDPANPDAEGKTFLYRYGSKIMEKITEKMNPDESLGEERINVFDFWNGCNFRLKARKVNNQRNYDLSSFDNPSAHRGGKDKVLEEIWKKEYSLLEFTKAENFKSYEELKQTFLAVIGEEEGFTPSDTPTPRVASGAKRPTAADLNVEDHDEEETPPWTTAEETPAPKETKKGGKGSKAAPKQDDEEDISGILASLADED